MQLRYSPTSPYVRKVRVMAAETRLDEVIDLLETNPFDPDTDLAECNPVGKVPALITDDGLVLFDSPVICEYLDNCHGGARMVPVATPARWHILRLQAIGDGIMDAAIGVVMEGRRAEAERSSGFVESQRKKIKDCVDWLETHIEELEGNFNLGQISVACALGYLDFRRPAPDWRVEAPRLAAWFEVVNARASMQGTAP